MSIYDNSAIYRNSSGLGNFLHVTPALQFIAFKRKKAVRVFTRCSYIKEALRDAPFIKWVGPKLPNGSFWVEERQYDLTCGSFDYVFSWKKLTGEPWSVYSDKWYPYVDRPQIDSLPKGRYIVLLNGGAGGDSDFTAQKKMTGEMLSAVFDYANRFALRIIFCGTHEDYVLTIRENPDTIKYCEPRLQDIRESLALINNAKGIISNDTGLYHAACAMKKKLIVSTRVPIRGNKRPSLCIHTMNPFTEYVDVENWDDSIGAFIKRMKN